MGKFAHDPNAAVVNRSATSNRPTNDAKSLHLHGHGIYYFDFGIVRVHPILQQRFSNSSCLCTVLVHPYVPVVMVLIVALGFGAGLLLLDESRKLLVRQFPKSFIARLAW
jgi:hypothetical protein